MKKIDLITGFLGSGKTTFISEYADYLVRAGESVAIIVNDYGAINVDRLLLEKTLGDKCHLEMVIGGDPDCTRRRLKTKLIAMGMAGYTRVIVEPSGIFDADEFFDLLYEEPLERWYEPGNVINILDAGYISELSNNIKENVDNNDIEIRYLIASQVAKAGTVVLSKIEKAAIKLIDQAEVVNITKHYVNDCLKEFKCIRQISDLYIWKTGAVPDQDFSKISTSGYHSGEMIKLPVTDSNSFRSIFFFHVKTDVNKLEDTIKRIFDDSQNGRLIRLKGFIKDEGDKWLEVNATPQVINISPIAVGQELFILIGENLNQERIGEYWDEYRNTL
ncbi:MAG TPA: GTPase (G3E family) [Lachnospiraceae bacterium]|nr:GTPase (G3E family) [Lachnospiraceae bacterium]